MNSKWHLYISLAKSIIRIVGCVIGIILGSWIIAIVGIIIAEILGILEEIKDER